MFYKEAVITREEAEVTAMGDYWLLQVRSNVLT